MNGNRKIEPNHFAAKIDISLQNLADYMNRRKEYYDLREYIRAKVERVDLDADKRGNAIFIHIPKCGGTSVENQIKIYHGHRSAVYFQAYDRDFFERAFKFSIVRNPYDRLVSGFHYLKYHTTSPLNREWVARNIAPFDAFSEFAEALEAKAFSRGITGWKHFVPQWYFVCDKDRRLMIDYFGKIEAFDDFNAGVAQRSSVRLKNEVHRASERRPWQEYYSDKARRIVADLYQEDFRIFGYEQ